MSVTSSLCAAFASITLIGALWIPGAQLAGPPAAPQDAAEAQPFKPVARVSSLMSGIGSAFDKLRDVLPQTEDEHRLDAIVAWSEVIAELSNVNTQHRRKPDYIAMAADTRSIALELARAARADTPDEAQLTTLVASLDNSCATCHEAE